METVLAEKLSTAVQLGEANTRIRDYVDLNTLTGIHPLAFRQPAMHSGPPTSTAASISDRSAPLSANSHRSAPAPTGPTAPVWAPTARIYPTASLVITTVTTFADPLLQDVPRHGWNPTTGGGGELGRRWGIQSRTDDS